jgi:hypothetical protein
LRSLSASIDVSASCDNNRPVFWQYFAVVVGAFVGILWPFVIRLLRKLSPNIRSALDASPSVFRVSADQHPILRFVGWLLVAFFVAAVVASVNVVPLVTGDNAKKLDALGGWQYFLLFGEGFGLAALIEEPLKPR